MMKNLWPSLKRRSKVISLRYGLCRQLKKILKDLLGESMEKDKETEICETSECDRDQRASSEDIT